MTGRIPRNTHPVRPHAPCQGPVATKEYIDDAVAADGSIGMAKLAAGVTTAITAAEEVVFYDTARPQAAEYANCPSSGILGLRAA